MRLEITNAGGLRTVLADGHRMPSFLNLPTPSYSCERRNIKKQEQCLLAKNEQYECFK